MGYYPFRPLISNILSKLKTAAKKKEEVFGDDAKEAMLFFNGPHDWMFENEYARKKKGGYLPKAGDGEDLETIMPPTFRMCVNKVSEMRDLFGPSLYHQNPNILVEAHDPPVPPPQALGIVQPPPQPPVMTPMGPQPAPPTPQDMMFQQQMQQYQMVAQQQQDAATVNGFRADMLQYVLNFMQFENDKKSHMRRVIDEAIIKGMGIFTHAEETREGMQGNRITSNYETVDNLLLDPDAEKWEDLTWTSIRCVKPVFEIEKEYKLPRGSLKGKGTLEEGGDDEKDKTLRDAKAKGVSNELMVYYKWYSKMGMGDKLSGAKDDEDDALGGYKGKLDEFGPYCYLVVAEGVPYFLNMPPHVYGDPEDDDVSEEQASDVTDPDELELPRIPVMQTQTDPLTGIPSQTPQIDPETGEPETQLDPEVFLSVQWPIPLWADGGWMFTPLYFRAVPGQVWPMSLVKPGIGWLRLINWIMSFMAGRIRRSCITTIGLKASVDEEITKTLLSGKDFQILKFKELSAPNAKFDEIIDVLQYPDVGQDLWKMAEAAMDGFAKATGLNELIYGQTVHHDRSAAESEAKQQATLIRPDDMANEVEDCASKVARREAMALRWLWKPEDAVPILGQLGAQGWANLMQSVEIDQVAREFNYRVEAGSARKPNKDTRIAQMNEVGQTWGALLTQYTFATGDMGPINAVMQAWGKANDVPIPMLQPPPQPQPGQPPQQGKPPPKPGGAPKMSNQNRISQHVASTNGAPTHAQGA